MEENINGKHDQTGQLIRPTTKLLQEYGIIKKQLLNVMPIKLEQIGLAERQNTNVMDMLISRLVHVTYNLFEMKF